jgi:hypothetical protein
MLLQSIFEKHPDAAKSLYPNARHTTGTLSSIMDQGSTTNTSLEARVPSIQLHQPYEPILDYSAVYKPRPRPTERNRI